MSEPDGLLAVAFAFFVIAASPGPATLACAAVSMRSGRACGMQFGLGLSIGLAFWGLIAATGLGAILQTSTHVLVALKILGGLYLLWLAFGSARSAMRDDSQDAQVEDRGSWFWRGLVLNLSNPKAVVAWMAALSLGMADGHGIADVSLATAVCAVLGALCYAGYALAFSMGGVMRTYRSVRRWVDGVVAGLFVLAGVGLIRSAFVR